ncbi:hypothetical protein MXB_102 [Myxobolus squamalis]|nr:hypothetical protein MXB_102 [Myxobolus squamalis]
MNDESNRILALNNTMRMHVVSSISYYLALFNGGKSIVFMQKSESDSALFSWIQNYMLQDLLSEQSKSISKNDFKQLIESFAHVSLCFTSFDRLNIDMQGSIELIFYQTIVNFYTQYLENVQNDFKIEISSFSSTDVKNLEMSSSKTLPPSSILLFYIPLANLYNCFLVVKNAFASFSSVEIALWLSSKLQNVLQFCAGAIMSIPSFLN